MSELACFHSASGAGIEGKRPSGDGKTVVSFFPACTAHGGKT